MKLFISKHCLNRITAFSAVLLLTGSSFALGADKNSISTSRTPNVFRCDLKAKLCVWTDGSDELHALSAQSDAEAEVQMLLSHNGGDMASPELDSKISGLRKTYKALHKKLRQSWSIPATLIASDTIHTNLLTLSMAAQQVTAGWTTQISSQLTQDETEGHNRTMAVAFPVASILAYNALPIGAFVVPFMGLDWPAGAFGQNMVFQLLARYAIPTFLLSEGYSWTDIPSVMAASIHDIQAEKIRADIAAMSRLLLAQTALRYVLQPDGMKQLMRDTLHQEAQYQRLIEFSGAPISLGEATHTFASSRDFRLAYAAKIGPIVVSKAAKKRDKNSEALNNFIVTGHFGELSWVNDPMPASGAIYDVYLRPGDTEYSAAIGVPSDNRRKRTWSLNWRGDLVAKDHGKLSDGRWTRGAHLVLAFWDEPVKPSGDSGPILKGSLTRGNHAETVGSIGMKQGRDSSNFTPPASGTAGH